MKNKVIRAAFAALVLVALLCQAALAKVVSPGEDFYYLDQAGVLSDALCGEIYFSNQLLAEACGAEFVVVALKTTGSTAIDDYADELMNTWKIGDSKKQNGFLLLLAIEDEDYCAWPGTGLQPKFTSGSIRAYTDDYLEEDFAAGRYDAGVKKFFEAVFARIADTYDADVTTAQGVAAYEAFVAEENQAYEQEQQRQAQSTTQTARNTTGSRQPQRESSGGGFGLIVALVIVVVVILLISRSRRRRVAPRPDPVQSANIPPAFGGTTPPPQPQRPHQTQNNPLPYIVAGEALRQAQHNAHHATPVVTPRTPYGGQPNVNTRPNVATTMPRVRTQQSSGSRPSAQSGSNSGRIVTPKPSAGGRTSSGNRTPATPSSSTGRTFRTPTTLGGSSRTSGSTFTSRPSGGSTRLSGRTGGFGGVRSSGGGGSRGGGVTRGRH